MSLKSILYIKFCSSSLDLSINEILLITPSICTLEKLLKICERELNVLDMVINARKLCCGRIGPRNSSCCCSTNIANGPVIPWTDESRYLGVFTMRSGIFKCFLIHAKNHSTDQLMQFLVRRTASEHVTLHLIYSKCIPILLYGLEACRLTKSDWSYLDFVLNRFMMKLFNSKYCRCGLLPSEFRFEFAKRFMVQASTWIWLFASVDNYFCKSYV